MKIAIIDSFSLIHRVYHALPYFTNPKGEPSGAVYGFCSVLLKILKDIQPNRVIAAFDSPEPTFRERLFPRYQADRPEKTEDFLTQIKRIRRFLDVAGVPVVAVPGFEGDDIIGTLAHLLAPKHEVVIVTGDGDMLQLVTDTVRVFTMRKGISDVVVYDKKTTLERLGFAPEFLPDYKALAGDVSDGIPGVPGIGQKTATKIIQRFSTIENVFASLEQAKNEKIYQKPVTEKLVQLLKENKEQIFLAKQLATIRTDVPISKDLLRIDKKENAPVLKTMILFFEQEGFYSLIKRLKNQGVEVQKFLPGLPMTKQIPQFVKASWQSVYQDIIKHKLLYWHSEGNTLYIGADNNIFCQVPDESESQLRQLFQNPSIQKIGFFAKEWMRNSKFFQNPSFLENLWDGALMAWLLDPDFKKYQPTALAARYLSVRLKEEEERSLGYIFGLVAQLFPLLRESLEQNELLKVYQDIELPLIPILVHMETSGIGIDSQKLNVVQQKLEQTLESLEKSIFNLAGTEFNLNSPKELSRILYDRLRLKSDKVKKLKSGYLSTDFEQLRRLEGLHPIIPKILKWREIAKLNNTYAKTLPGFIHSGTKRVHTHFIQTGTATGRLASDSPNMQNIPKHSKEAALIRSVFVAEKGFQFVSCDYSQIELRLVANLSKDRNLIRAFQLGQDVHRVTASLVWDIPLDQVDNQTRFKAKALNFGILYGMGARALSQAAGISLAESQEFIQHYFATFDGVRQYLDKTRLFLRENGYVKTQWGRRRYFPEIYSGKTQLVKQSERMALNLTIQGLAADIIKKAMIKIYQDIIQPKNGLVRLLLQIHDELLFEIKNEIIDIVVPQIQNCMEGVYLGIVPLRVDVRIGKYWSELE